MYWLKATLLTAFMCTITEINADLVLSNRALSPDRQVLAGSLAPDIWRATPITTDGEAYTLHSITAEIFDLSPAGTLFIEIWSVNSATYAPEASIDRLILTQSTASDKTFSGSINLEADTSYFVVSGVDQAGGQWEEQLNFTDTLQKDFIVDAGSWLLETQTDTTPKQISYSSANSGGAWSADALLEAPLRMDIDASIIPEPATVSIVCLGGAITLFAHRFRRREDQDNPNE